MNVALRLNCIDFFYLSASRHPAKVRSLVQASSSTIRVVPNYPMHFQDLPESTKTIAPNTRNKKMEINVKMNRTALATTLVMLTASAIASAGEPAVLCSQKMDAVAAGSQQSTSAAIAAARLGVATTSSQSIAQSFGQIQYTSSTSAGVAVGIGATAQATALTLWR